MVFWGMMAGLERLSTQGFGPQLGIAVIYLIAAPLAFLLRRPHEPQFYGWRYLLVSGALFAGTDILTGLAIGHAATSAQTVQVTIVNYLWPTLTVLGNLVFGRDTHANWLIIPGTVLATLGVATVVGGDAGLDLPSIAANIYSNPLPFAFALGDALCWSAYSVVTPRISGGKDALAYMFTATFVSGWAVWGVTSLLAGPQVPLVPLGPASFIMPVLTAVVLVLGYLCWNVGILRGNPTTLSTLSYLTPICSSVASMIILGITLAPTFWAGLAMVVAGSLLSFLSTHARKGV